MVGHGQVSFIKTRRTAPRRGWRELPNLPLGSGAGRARAIGETAVRPRALAIFSGVFGSKAPGRAGDLQRLVSG